MCWIICLEYHFYVTDKIIVKVIRMLNWRRFVSKLLWLLLFLTFLQNSLKWWRWKDRYMHMETFHHISNVFTLHVCIEYIWFLFAKCWESNFEIDLISKLSTFIIYASTNSMCHWRCDENKQYSPMEKLCSFVC